MNITRDMRDGRLQAYIPLGDAALGALRELEESLSREKAGDEDKTKPLWDVRKSARAAMREHETFLGGTHEMGLALRTPGWSPNMPCYLCSAIMGYRNAGSWSERSRREYDTTFS